ncbi:MAG: hypothetical protein WCT03_15950 [Candidatus Obscuribacterales bacterium]|jgi:hypothetical protein
MRASDGSVDLKQTIIDNYRSQAQAVRPDYLAYLTQKSLAYSDRVKQTAISAEQAQAALDQGTMALVDRIFALLEPYTQEINRINRVKELHLSCVAPSRSSEALELDRSRRPSKSTCFYRSRFSTSKLSLVIRGLQGKIEFFIFAADRVMGLSNEEACHEPLMVFEAEIGSAENSGAELGMDSSTQGRVQVSWQVEGKPLSPDRFERFTLLALEHLIDRSHEELG